MSPLTEAQRQELARRLADDDAHPADGIPWEVVKAEARARREIPGSEATRNVRFFDASRNLLATAQVGDEGGHFGGTINLSRMPEELRKLFDEFEEIVNGQMFSFLDEIQAKIAAVPLTAVFDDGLEATVTDLQIYPGTGDISFRLAEILGQRAASA